MSFDMKKYISLMQQYNFDEADQYRQCNVPNKLYKFVYINETSNCTTKCKYENLNNIKIKSLEEKKFWLSTRKNLNDPFELKSLFINKDMLEKYDFPIEIVHALQLEYEKYLIGCFTIESNLINSMPMWAHYTNNHKGFCVEYKINNPEFFYQISYESGRTLANAVYVNLVILMMKNANSKLTNIEKQELYSYSQMLFHNIIIKHESWKYENEWRLIFPTCLAEKHIDVYEGALIPMNILGIEPTGIYLGMNCEKIYVNKLKDLSKKLGIDIYKMNFNDLTNEYMLSYNKI